MFQLTNVMELDDFTVTFRGTYTDQRFQMFDDNDHIQTQLGHLMEA